MCGYPLSFPIPSAPPGSTGDTGGMQAVKSMGIRMKELQTQI